MNIEKGKKIPEGHSNSQIENTLTQPWLRKKKIYKQITVHKTVHRKTKD